MLKSTLNDTPAPASLVENGPPVIPSQQLSSGASVSISLAQPPLNQSADGGGTSRVMKGYLSEKLDDAERLLGYAAEIGVDIEEDTRNDVLKARFASDIGISEQTAANLLSALTKLAARMRPVTAESLKVCATPRTARSVSRFYIWVAIILIAIIVPYSILAFISTGLSDKIGQDVETANALAVKLTDELEPPQSNNGTPQDRGIAKPLPPGIGVKDVIKDLQQFASAIRVIDSRATQLQLFAVGQVSDRLADARKNPKTMRSIFELPSDLPDLPAAEREKIQVYQDVRYFAQNTRERVALTFGAIANHILPMLYALLGACAYLARMLEEQLKTRTLTIADRHAVHFLIAGIGGLVVGLFTNLNLTQGVTLPPLAFAFLVGYAVDSFFSFLESFLQLFNRSRSATGPQSSAGGMKT